jgi:translation initiation factor 1 (eIF-1/SUI1)
MNLALKDTKWENVRKRIRIAIEEEKRRKATISIQGADGTFIAGAKQVEEPIKNILVTATASDSGLASQGGA